MEPTSGIPHVTAIASNPQRNLDFYAEVLGLRLVERTVNSTIRERTTSTLRTRQKLPARF